MAVYSCGTKKDTIISRNYQALTTKFNVLFNGKEAFKEGVTSIENGFKDDYFNQLSIEPIEFEEDKIVIPKFSNGLGSGFDDQPAEVEKELTPFEIAEEKAVKAIQKHGMNINGYERNRQIDDAYLLLGKSRYYSQRFIPALEAFNYVITTYPNANLLAETKIWRAKTNIRLDNEEFAIETLKLLLMVNDSIEADLPDVIKEQAHTALAMAYEKADSLQKVKKHLALATRTFKNKEQAARNMFILGQIYSSENKKDSATMVFNKLIKIRKAPYKYKIHGHIEVAKNSTTDSSSVVLIEKMNALIKDRDNRPYLDELYYQVGVLHEQNDSINKAISNYNKSLQANNGTVKQKTFTYEKLANLYFKDSEYLLASNYYDSVINVAEDTLNLRYKRIKRKHKNLASLIKFEEVVTTNDSIIKIVSLSKEDQTLFFQNYIEKLKKKDEEIAQLRLNQLAFGGSFGGNSLQSSKKGKWYFYNNQSLAFGKTEFTKIWGNRKSEDNWRWSSKQEFNETGADSVQVNQKNLRYDLASYLETIPTRKEAIDSLKTDRNEALYELGVIYKEQFKNKTLAVNRLERVATLQPKKELVLPINWHLYQLHTGLNNVEKANKHKELILEKYPETLFAQRIKNPTIDLTQESLKVNEVENAYKEVFYLYKENKFEETVLKINEILPTLKNAILTPKFELLKAYAIGKFNNKEAYKTAMEFVAVSYGNTEEGKKAKEIINQLNN